MLLVQCAILRLIEDKSDGAVSAAGLVLPAWADAVGVTVALASERLLKLLFADPFYFTWLMTRVKDSEKEITEGICQCKIHR